MDERSLLVRQIARLRRLADGILDTEAKEKLLSLAKEYEERLAALDRKDASRC
jgi:hypothetical protein